MSTQLSDFSPLPLKDAQYLCDGVDLISKANHLLETSSQISLAEWPSSLMEAVNGLLIGIESFKHRPDSEPTIAAAHHEILNKLGAQFKWMLLCAETKTMHPPTQQLCKPCNLKGLAVQPEATSFTQLKGYFFRPVGL